MQMLLSIAEPTEKMKKQMKLIKNISELAVSEAGNYEN
jgi:hypothetical protein